MEYVSITEAAKLLHISRPTLYKLIAAGKVKTKTIADRQVIALTHIASAKSSNGRVGRKGGK